MVLSRIDAAEFEKRRKAAADSDLFKSKPKFSPAPEEAEGDEAREEDRPRPGP